MTPVIKSGTTVLNSVLLTPSSASASSVSGAWVATNALVRDGTWWMSGVDTNNEEWLQYDFGSPVLISGIYAAFTNGRNGANNKIQGSTDGTTWTDLHTFDGSKFVYNINGDNQQTYANTIAASAAYRYIRLYSAASPYCMYDFVQYSGVK